MTASVNIKRGDLHLAVSTAFNRGRYVLMTAGGDGQPVEITIDLRERPDDLFDAEGQGTVDIPTSRREDIGKWRPFDVPVGFRVEPVTDDHGPAIPAQTSRIETPFGAVEGIITDADGKPTGHRVYEFALQDAVEYSDFTPTELRDVTMDHSPDYPSAVTADWVHVYDRVTRERRTLKRPEPDAVLTGLRDVAADLRAKASGYPFDQAGVTVDSPRGWAVGDWACCVVPVGKYAVGDLARVTCVDRAGGFLGFTGDGATFFAHKFVRYDGALTEEPQRGAPVEPPFGCAPLPPVGPLTSTEGLKAGDVLRSVTKVETCRNVGDIIKVNRVDGDRIHYTDRQRCPVHSTESGSFAFVGRPDTDGWMTWPGGENPVPGAVVEYRMGHSQDQGGINPADRLFWRHDSTVISPARITAFRIVDATPAV